MQDEVEINVDGGVDIMDNQADQNNSQHIMKKKGSVGKANHHHRRHTRRSN